MPPYRTSPAQPQFDADSFLRSLDGGRYTPEVLDKTELVIDEASGSVRQAGADATDGPYVLGFRQHAEQSLYFFAKAILGLTRLTSSLHQPICDWLQVRPPYRKLYLLPRDHLKTSIARALMLHILIQPKENNLYFPGCWDVGCGKTDCDDPEHRFEGRDARIMYGGETAANAEKQLAWARAKLDGSKLLRALWPQVVWADSRKESPKWAGAALQVRRTKDFPEASIEAIGVGGAVTGRHYDVLVKDDIATLEAANSRVAMETAIEWNKSTRALMDDPDKSLEFMLGTRWAPGDVWETIEHDDPTVEVVCRAILEDGRPIFPEMFSVETIERLRREEGPLFWLIRMNSSNSPEVSDFDLSLLRSYTVEGNQLSFTEEARDAALATMLQAPPPEPPGVTVDQSFRGQRFTPEVQDKMLARNEYLRMKA